MDEHRGHRERLRQKFLQHGLDSFHEHEVLELILFYAIARKDTNPLAHRLIEQFGGLEEVLCAPMEELCRVPGVGENTAALLKLFYPVYNKARCSTAGKERILNAPERAGEYLLALFAGIREERLYQLCLDAKGKLVGKYLLNVGTVDAVSFSGRQVAANALQSQASAVILGHNHPSGVAIYSEDDVTATRIAAEALRALNVQLIDHIIVADNDFVSMSLSGVIW